MEISFSYTENSNLVKLGFSNFPIKIKGKNLLKDRLLYYLFTERGTGPDESFGGNITKLLGSVSNKRALDAQLSVIIQNTYTWYKQFEIDNNITDPSEKLLSLTIVSTFKETDKYFFTLEILNEAGDSVVIGS